MLSNYKSCFVTINNQPNPCACALQHDLKIGSKYYWRRYIWSNFSPDIHTVLTNSFFKFSVSKSCYVLYQKTNNFVGINVFSNVLIPDRCQCCQTCWAQLVGYRRGWITSASPSLTYCSMKTQRPEIKGFILSLYISNYYVC